MPELDLEYLQSTIVALHTEIAAQVARGKKLAAENKKQAERIAELEANLPKKDAGK